jgi:hypothetical protein
MCLGKWWSWEGLYLPSNPFWLLKRTRALSIFNWMSSFQSFDDKKGPS